MQNDSGSRYLEDELWDIVINIIDDEQLARAMFSLYGWSGHEVPPEFGFTVDEIGKARARLELEARARETPILEEAVRLIESWLPCAVPTLGYWLSVNNVVRPEGIGWPGLLEAIELVGMDIPFRTVSKTNTKWIVSKNGADDREIERGDRFAEFALSSAIRWGIVDPRDFEWFGSDPDSRLFWESMEASPDLKLHDHDWIVAKKPRDDGELVKRLDRLLAYLEPVPLSIAHQQVLRGDRKGRFAGLDIQKLRAFATHCEYYDLHGDEVSSSRRMVIDEKLALFERPVIEALMGAGGSLGAEDLAEILPESVISAKNMLHALETSSLILGPVDGKYSLPSAQLSKDYFGFESLLDDRIVKATLIKELEEQFIDLSVIGVPGENLWSMYAGDIPLEQLQGAVNDRHVHMGVMDPESGKCVGLVNTRRVRNKYEQGIPVVLLNDKGLKGMELPRYVTLERLRAACAQTYLFFYNYTSENGEIQWGMLERSQIQF